MASQGYLMPASNIQMPDKIKCIRCNKTKPLNSYSATRQNDLRERIRKFKNGFNAAATAVIPCTMCTCGQVTELECRGCKKWMGLNSFSKVMRRTPDRALCWKCSQDQQNLDPGADSDLSEVSNSDDDADDSDGSEGSNPYTFDDNVSVVSGGVSLLNINTPTPSTNNSGGGVRLPTPTASSSATMGGTIYGGPSVISASRGNSTANGSLSARPSATTTSPAALWSTRSYASSVASNSTASPAPKRNPYAASGSRSYASSAASASGQAPTRSYTSGQAPPRPSNASQASRPVMPRAPSPTNSVVSSVVSNSTTTTTTTGGFNKNKYGNPASRPVVRPSARQTPGPSSANGAFAKVKAGPRKIDMDTARAMETPGGMAAAYPAATSTNTPTNPSPRASVHERQDPNEPDDDLAVESSEDSDDDDEDGKGEDDLDESPRGGGRWKR